MKKTFFIIIVTLFFLILVFVVLAVKSSAVARATVDSSRKYSYWFSLKRQMNIEVLYKGVEGDIRNSFPVAIFRVKTGITHKRPTPLPQLFGREYWLVIAKEATDNPETGPYFLTLNIPSTDQPPYGPSPYLECYGQCNWSVPGAFGLHGVGGDKTRLLAENPGSSGCIRHTDADISYLYHLLDPEDRPIRYYIEK